MGRIGCLVYVMVFLMAAASVGQTERMLSSTPVPTMADTRDWLPTFVAKATPTITPLGR